MGAPKGDLDEGNARSHGNWYPILGSFLGGRLIPGAGIALELAGRAGTEVKFLVTAERPLVISASVALVQQRPQ